MNELDKHIYDLKEDKKVLQSLERLMTNSDFKRVILNDFLVKHPLSLVMSKGRLNLEDETKHNIERQLDCIALFKMYLDTRVSEIADIDMKIIEAETLRDEQTRNT